MITTRSKGRASALALAALALAVIAASCKGATISSGASGKDSAYASDLRISLRVLGVNPAVEPGASSSISRLLLPTARNLTVVLVPTDPSLPIPDSQTIPIGSTSATVTFEGLEFGEYDVVAAATDASGEAAFMGTATVTFSSSANNATLDLLPMIFDTLLFNNFPNYQRPLINIDAESAKTYLLLPGILSEGESNPIPAGAFELSFDSVGSPLNVFVQNFDGSLLFSGDVTTDGEITKTGGTSGGSGSVITIYPASISEPIYLTIYNGGASLFEFYVTLNQDNMT